VANRILLVDDEADFLQVFGDWLRFKGYDVTEARDGRSALDAMRSGDFDLVILDLMMPKLDGYDFCKALRGDRSLQGTPILVLTAVPKHNGLYNHKSMGISDYKEKLVSHAEISLAIDRLIAEKEGSSRKGGSLQ